MKNCPSLTLSPQILARADGGLTIWGVWPKLHTQEKLMMCLLYQLWYPHHQWLWIPIPLQWPILTQLLDIFHCLEDWKTFFRKRWSTQDCRYHRDCRSDSQDCRSHQDCCQSRVTANLDPVDLNDDCIYVEDVTVTLIVSAVHSGRLWLVPSLSMY